MSGTPIDQRRDISEGTRRPTHPAKLAFAVFGGTALWTVHLIASYSIANYACGHVAALWALHALTIVAVAIAGSAVAVSFGIIRGAAHSPADERSSETNRDQFLASGGLLLGSLGLMAIALGELAVIIGGCGP